MTSFRPISARPKCVTGYAEMSNDLTDCLDFDYQQTRDRLIGWLIYFLFFYFFFNAPFSLFFRDSLLDFEMGKVKVFFFIFYVLILLFFVLEIFLILFFFIFLVTVFLNLELVKINSF